MSQVDDKEVKRRLASVQNTQESIECTFIQKLMGILLLYMKNRWKLTRTLAISTYLQFYRRSAKEIVDLWLQEIIASTIS